MQLHLTILKTKLFTTNIYIYLYMYFCTFYNEHFNYACTTLEYRIA